MYSNVYRVSLKLKYILRDIRNFFIKMLPDIIRIMRFKPYKRYVFLFDMPTYSNLGDQAIGLAEELFFSYYFPVREIVRVPGFMVKYWVCIINLISKPSDLVVHIGGGNFGDLYPEIDVNRERIVKRVKNCPIIMFPQSVFYTNTEYGLKRLSAMQKSILNKTNICILTRDKESYKYARQHFACDVMLIPDIVLFLNAKKQKIRRYLLLCLRDDKEKNQMQIDVETLCRKTGLPLKKKDTIYDGQVMYLERNRILELLWDEFSSASLVITDRLHGMIFSAITNTPCIVMPNNNNKITSFYNTWFKDINFIQFAESEGQLLYNIDLLENLSISDFDTLQLKKYYDELAGYIASI